MIQFRKQLFKYHTFAMHLFDRDDVRNDRYLQLYKRDDYIYIYIYLSLVNAFEFQTNVSLKAISVSDPPITTQYLSTNTDITFPIFLENLKLSIEVPETVGQEGSLSREKMKFFKLTILV